MTYGNIIFIFGGLLAAVGISLMIPLQRIYTEIIKGTEHLSNGLLRNECFDNWKQIAKRRKLNNFSTSKDVSEEIQAASKKALRIEIIFYVLVFSGMIALLLGATTIGAIQRVDSSVEAPVELGSEQGGAVYL
jgi:hypothetical protein